ncbi:DinB family protein [Danxiaibacter flavus]|uniref:DinB family protein n=1 Tax=Danxiaibacter flavus TaxID=3049108 RepID=A0ABV3ZMG0_9BACT|nr:DinB family protein [Chitinophagaceae bacterium DXS]
MSIQTIITDIRAFLVNTFSTIDTWFDKDIEVRNYRPVSGGWTINEILEHIGLTNHFLLILIDKGTNKALQNIQKLDLQTALQNHVFHWDKLTEVGLHKSFTWIRPEHMEPTGNKELDEVRNQLKEQLSRCLDNLDRMMNGEGILYKTTMTVNDLGKIDVYEYIYFLAQHGQRHITQMQKNELEFKSM